MLRLRPGQQEVAQYRGGLMAVPAVPGAGKTTVLAHLAAELIAEDRPRPGKILIVTVMNSAVANFRYRIGNFLEKRGLPRNQGYEVKTIHSLAMTILKEKTEELLINNSFQVLDEARQAELIREVALRWLDSNIERCLKPFKLTPEKDKAYHKSREKWQKQDLPQLFKQGISYVKSRGINTQQAEQLRRSLPEDNYLAWVLEVYAEYVRELRAKGWLDFDDLISQALRLLQTDEGVLARLQRRWTFIFEDEAQDSNPLQEEILKLLAGVRGNFVRVGDSNQAIMGTFTSAEPEIFRSFCRRKDVRKESILVSSRSSRQVIDLANYLITWARTKHPQVECRNALEEQIINPVSDDDPFPNPRVDGYTLGVKKFTNRDQEIRGIARLACLQVQKRPENTLAILVPTRSMQEEFAARLRELGAHFIEVGKVTEEQAKTIFDVKVALDYLAQPHKVNYLLQVLTQVLLPELSPEGAAGLAALFARYPLEEVLFPIGGEIPWLQLPDELLEQELYQRFIQAVQRLKTWLAASVDLAPEDLVLFLAEDLQLVEEQLEIANNLTILIKQRVGENPNWKLIDIARDLPRIEDSLRNFARTVCEQKGFVPQPGVITLLTTHKAKGLEWDTVYLPGVTIAEYPSLTSDRFRSDLWFLQENLCNPLALVKAQLKQALGQNPNEDPVQAAKLEEISERLRLLYVAITRAKKNLLISYHENSMYQKQGPSLALRALEEFMRKEAVKYAEKQA